ncbi:MAG: ATP-dependent helicase/nuclease subunit A [Myxococcota bacterium]|jgi:ATP-dependent helicase/nuclease subunit A
MSAHQQIKLASAGTGKTFSLSNIYLNLFTAGQPAQNILGSTFTRKAVAEILKRLFERLVEGVEDPGKLEELKHFDAIPQNWEAADVKECVVKLALCIDQIKIITLDSYFNKIASQHRRELGLPLQWRMSEYLQDQELLQTAINNYVAGNNLKDIVKLVASLDKNDSPRNFLEMLLTETAATLDLINDSTPQAFDCIRPHVSVASQQQLLDKLDGIPNIIDNREKQCIQKREHLIAAIKDGDLKAILKQSTYANGQWYKKPLHADWLDLCPLAIDYARGLATQQVITRNKSYASMFSAVRRELHALRQQRRLFNFSDITHLVADAVAQKSIDLADGELNLLLDEFQDTAVLQWRILQPQIAASINAQRTLFTVGDTKQAIYGWRSGDSRLLSGFKQWADDHSLGANLEQSSLNVNYRSSSVILGTTDLVFGNAKSLAPHKDEVATAINQWTEGYQDHKAGKDIPGCALLFEVNPTSELTQKQAAAVAAAARAAELHMQAPSKSIAILVRSNSMLALIQNELRKRDVLAGSHGGVSICDAESVLITLSWLTAVFYPGDSLALFHVQSSTITSFGSTEDLSKKEFDRHAQLQRRTILSIGFSDYLQRHLQDITRCFASGHDQHRMQQLLDLASRFDQLDDKSACDFVEYIRTTKVSESAETKVRLMTIHAAKGLEFDAVILPQLEGALMGSIHRQIAIGSRPDIRAPYSKLCAYPSSVYADLIPELGELEFELGVQRSSESMSALYVALTRAVERVEMMIPKASASGETDRTSCLLRNGLDLADEKTSLAFEAPDGVSLKWQHPDSDLDSWKQSATELPASTTPLVSPFSASTAPRLLKRVSPSQSTESSSYVGADILIESSAQNMARGSRIHALLQDCEWLDNFECHDDELQTMLSKVHVREKLTRPATANLEVWRERDFSVLIKDSDSNSYISRGCFDRVVIERNANGAPLSAEIIDYKTGRVNDAMRAKYQTQLDEYTKALQLLLGLPLGQINSCLLELDA